jgi:copper chaperone CopZ
MATICFSVPSIDTGNETADLGSSLIGLSGVERVDMDNGAHTVTVLYDPDFADRETLSQIITHSGYPLQASHEP